MYATCHGGCVLGSLALCKSYREDKLPIMEANAMTMTMNARSTRIGASRLCDLGGPNVPSRGASNSGSISNPIADIRRGGSRISSSVSSAMSIDTHPCNKPTTQMHQKTPGTQSRVTIQGHRIAAPLLSRLQHDRNNKQKTSETATNFPCSASPKRAILSRRGITEFSSRISFSCPPFAEFYALLFRRIEA